MKCVLPWADYHESFVQRQADAKFTMPSTSRVAAGLLSEIHECVARYNVNQIFRRATTKCARVLALGVEPTRRYDVAQSLKLLAELPQRKSF
jgi:hypothetical protein